MNYFLQLPSRFVTSVRQKLKFLGGIAALIVYSARNYITDSRGRKRINKVMVMQVYFTGNLALRLISVVALALGAISILQLFTQLNKLGVSLDLVGKVLNIVIIRELGPIITAFIVISRSGTAIAAEIGTMMVNDEVNALEMLGIDTLKFIVFPRIAGMVIAFALLNIYFNAVGIIGGFLVGGLAGNISFDMFSHYVMSEISLVDIIASVVKSSLFGLFISAISIYHGFQAFTSTQIPQVTTKAVMSSIIAMIVVDVAFTVVFYL